MCACRAFLSRYIDIYTLELDMSVLFDCERNTQLGGANPVQMERASKLAAGQTYAYTGLAKSALSRRYEI